MHVNTFNENGGNGTNITPSTYNYDSSLPKLPIPDLELTCDRFLQTVEPLQTLEEHEQTKAAVKAFLETSGPELQQQLVDYAKDEPSYIENFWYNSYLSPRGSVVLNLNPFFVLEDDPTPSRNNQISRASSLILSTLKFVRALRTETLEPDVWRNTPLCMHQFRSIFGCARIPTEGADVIQRSEESRHMAVMCRNQFYWFDVIWQDGTPAITEQELCNNLRLIHKDANELSNVEASENAIGVFTTEKRSNWCTLRAKLAESNTESLRIVDSALFLVCLDDTSPPTSEEFAATALHGTYKIEDGIQTGSCTNRWYDKLQIIVCENGVAGVNFEHTVVDGHTVLRFVSDVYTDTIIRFAQTIRNGASCLLQSSYLTPKGSKDPRKPDIAPRKLEWDLSKDLSRAIMFAESKLSDLILQNEVKVLEFTGYGKQFIVQHNMSPDAFVQLAFAASYYALYGTVVNIYEPVLTKRFSHGRTEAARSTTKDAVAFCKTFCDESATEIDKLGALRKALQTQVEIVKRSSKGEGVDRHLFALYSIWDKMGRAKGQDVPPIFADGGWAKLNETVLSTSNCGNPALRLFGFGPVIPSGFGIGYIIKDEGIQICASSSHRQTSRFLDTLRTYLLEVQVLLVKEEATRFPNLLRKRVRSVSQRGGFVDTGGYGFFDDGTASNDAVMTDARVGKRLG